LYYDANIAFRILVKIIQGCGTGALDLGIFPGAGAQIKKSEGAGGGSQFKPAISNPNGLLSQKL